MSCDTFTVAMAAIPAVVSAARSCVSSLLSCVLVRAETSDVVSAAAWSLVSATTCAVVSATTCAVVRAAACAVVSAAT